MASALVTLMMANSEKIDALEQEIARCKANEEKLIAALSNLVDAVGPPIPDVSWEKEYDEAIEVLRIVKEI